MAAVDVAPFGDEEIALDRSDSTKRGAQESLMYPHSIRLRGPWEFQTLDDEPRTGSMTLGTFWHHGPLPDYWGQVALRRRFNWIAKIADDEIVWLCVDRCIGRATFQLNGRQLGAGSSIWGECRFDVTELLRPSNELVIQLDASAESDLHFGSLGHSEASAPAGKRHPVGGILGGVCLTVESKAFLPRGVLIQTDFEGGKGSLSFGAETQIRSQQSELELVLLLDGRTIHRQVLDPTGGDRWNQLSIELAGLEVEPWWCRELGPPRLHELSLCCRRGGEVVHELAWPVGFRRIEQIDPATWSVNDRTVHARRLSLWPDRSFAPGFGEDPEKVFDVWRLAQGNTVHVVGHFAPDSFYRLCDRAGLMVEQDVPANPRGHCGALARVARLSAHPSLAAWLIPQGAPNEAELTASLRAIDSRRAVRPVQM